MAIPVSLREFSRQIGVCLRTVQIAIENKRVTAFTVKEVNGKKFYYVDAEVALAEWNAYTDHFQRGRPTLGELAGRGPFGERLAPHSGVKRTGGAPPPPEIPVIAPVSAPIPPDSPPKISHKKHENHQEAKLLLPESTYQKARGAREVYTAKMLEMKYQLESGALVPIKDVKALFFEIAKTVQQNLLNIPSRIAPILAAELDERRIHDTIDAEIVKALESLAEESLESLSH